MSLNVSLRLLRSGAENKYKSSLKIYIYISWSARVDTIVRDQSFRAARKKIFKFSDRKAIQLALIMAVIKAGCAISINLSAIQFELLEAPQTMTTDTESVRAS